MIRNLKALGLALVAVCAMSAMTASAASANNDVFTVGDAQTKALLTGFSHDNVFTAGNTKFECTTSKFVGTAVNNATTATALAAYSGTKNVVPHSAHCTSSTLGTVTVDMNDCHYRLTGSTTGLDEGKADATIWIECPAGKEIQITSSTGAVVSVPSQTPTVGGVTYANITNHPGGAAVKVTATATGVTYTCSTAFLCGLAGLPTEGNNANYTGTVTVTGFKDENATSTNLTEVKEGTQVPVEVTTKP